MGALADIIKQQHEALAGSKTSSANANPAKAANPDTNFSNISNFSISKSENFDFQAPLEATATIAVYEPVALQREANRRNADAQRMGLTDRWCACGARATFAWPDGRRRDVWRCLDCGPVRGRA
jgi:hypothetical protein